MVQLSIRNEREELVSWPQRASGELKKNPFGRRQHVIIAQINVFQVFGVFFFPRNPLQ